MSYRYMLLPEHSGTARDCAAETALLQMGLSELRTGLPARIYVSPETPALRLRDGGILLGHAFNQHGGPLGEAEHGADAMRVSRSFMLDRCWGDYLLIEPAPGPAPGISVTRDPSGGVECFYAMEHASAFVTSDVSIAVAIGQLDRTIDWAFVDHFLTYPYLKTARTGLTGVRELLPGCTLTMQAHETTLEVGWSPRTFMTADRRHINAADAATLVRSAVEGTVHALVANDRRILLELSGGLDSSIVAACLGATKAEVVCATLVPERPGADERIYAQAVAASLGFGFLSEGLDVESARFDGALARSATRPAAGPLQYAVDLVMQAAAAREHVDCFYSGGGGDIIFSYLPGAAPAADAFKAQGLGAGFRAVHDLSALHQCTWWRALRTTYGVLTRRRSRAVLPDTRWLHPAYAPPLADQHPWHDTSTTLLPGDRERVEGLAGAQLFREAMPRAATRTVRLPLLSQPVMEACLSIPSWMWIEGGRNRAVARRAFSDALPTNVLARRSKGTFAQYNAAVYRRFRSEMRSFLLDGALAARNLLDADALRDVFDQPQLARDRAFTRIFDLCRAESWIRQQH